MFDTIAVISTALGVGAISTIRVSGNDAIINVNKIFSGDLTKKDSHTITYGYIKESDTTIDEVLVSVMKSPKTFTRENVVEISCHGGIAITNKILQLLLNNGCRLAEPGEFTKRAFLNGRIDLIEAEAVMDLVSVKSEEARKIAISNLQGNTTKTIRELRQQILELLSSIEVNIDYPEYEDIEIMTNQKVQITLKNIKERTEEIINNSKNSKIIKEGINIAIVGRPNVGKSSLLNLILDEQKAIVTDIEGTTRDIVEGTINLDGILLNFIDTAGIRNTKDIIEKIGVEKSLEKMSTADLVLIVLNSHETLAEEDKEILEKTTNKKSLIVLNKSDLDEKIDLSALNNYEIVKTNTINRQGIKDLLNKIKEMFNLGKISTQDYNYLSNANQISMLEDCLKYLHEVERGIQQNMPIDMIEIDIKNMWNRLGEIIGETYTDELLDQLFSQFCLGK